jgi:hypothetical protein
MKNAMRARYAVHYTELMGVGPAAEGEVPETAPPAGKGSAGKPTPPPAKPTDPDEGKNRPLAGLVSAHGSIKEWKPTQPMMR